MLHCGSSNGYFQNILVKLPLNVNWTK